MKKIFAALLLLAGFLTPSAIAGVPCTLPFTLTNGTPADATQVMANYNALVTCLTQAAHAGANSDITSLTGLTTAISPTQGGTPTFVGADSTGTANAQVVASTVPATWTLTKGNNVVFKVGAGLSNTGAVTLAVSGTSATAVIRQSTGGSAPLVGSEFVAGQVVVVTYDGTQYQLINNPPTALTNALLGNPTGVSNLAGAVSLGSGLAFSGSSLVVTPGSFTFAPNAQVSGGAGSGTYSTPTAGGNFPLYLHVRMIAGGGGGGGQAGGGSPGGDSSFGAWTVIHGSPGGGGTSPAGGAGGVGGVNGTGAAITRIAGGSGSGVTGTGSGANGSGPGGNGFYGGAGGGVQIATTGQTAAANSGAGGGGGGQAGAGVTIGAGGGAGEYVEFIVTSPAASYPFSVGAGGAAGSNGGAGAAGRLEVIAHWQ